MKRKKRYHHLDQLKRDRIQALLESGHKQKEVARILDVDKGTISRELKRNRKKIRAKEGTRDGPYLALLAHHKAYARRKYARYQGKAINENDALQQYILARLKAYWSPDAISGRMRKEKRAFYASKTAIYEWLRTARGVRNCKYLYSERYYRKKQKKNKTKKALIPNRRGLVERPRGASNKTRYGHYEEDTIVSGKKTQSKKALAVLYERKARYTRLRRIDTLSPLVHNHAIKTMMRSFSKTLSITFDNGIENTKHEELNVPAFFCDPYSSWQKGGVENVNKAIRQFVLKGSDIGNYSDNDIARVERILNQRPRKSLDYQTPQEVMEKHHLLIRKKQPEIAL
ncbi:MAG: IS30 family transposase, partial [Nanoarchaeota archaeon]